MDLKLLTGNVVERLRELPAESVHCVVTSPPYWGLRDYGGFKMCVVWGKAKNFAPPKHPRKAGVHLDLLRMRAARKGIVWSKNRRAHICAYGLEPSIELYLQHTVEIFDEVRRVLRSDGVCWLNLGDSYAGSWSGYCDDKPNGIKREWKNPALRPPQSFVSKSKRLPRGKGRWGGGNVSSPNLKAKDLCGVPWRVALALQESGWWLRCDVIWFKPNPMPESTTDRPTKAHEYVFFLTKADRYFYDGEAIREATTVATNGEHPRPSAKRGEFNGKTNGLPGREAFRAVTMTRQKRSVWEIPTNPYKEAHFATFPPDLVKPCILAGTSAKGCCAECGAPWERVVELGEPDLEHQRACGGDANGEYFGEATKDFAGARAQNASDVKSRILAGMRERKTKGWIAGCECECDRPPRPCVVLDPFGGSGTTGMVALELGRHAVLVELNGDYAEMIKRRCAVTPGLQLA
jgi:DNA modification methylase